MQVSISKAAEMVGITRATLYRHIEKKGISVDKDEEGNPKIDVSELIRIYGHRVKTDVPETGLNGLDTVGTIQSDQDYTQKGAPKRSMDLAVEVEVLKERVKSLESAKDNSAEERKREREQLLEQIEMLRSSLSESEQQQKRLTLLITDQREKEQGAKTYPDAAVQIQKVEALEKTIQELKIQNRRIVQDLQSQKSQSFWKKLFG